MRVALYGRVSSERQAEKDLSIPAQPLLDRFRSSNFKNGTSVKSRGSKNRNTAPSDADASVASAAIESDGI